MTSVSAPVLEVLRDYVGTLVARSILNGAATACGVSPDALHPDRVDQFEGALEASVNAFIPDPIRARECAIRLKAALAPAAQVDAGSVTGTTLDVDIVEEYDIVTARNHTRSLCDSIGFGPSEQVKVATVVSELARNIVQYVGQGRIELEAIEGARRGIEIRAIDRGPGIASIDTVLSGGYRSKTGMGVGIIGTRKLMDDFEIDTHPQRGTRIVVRKFVA